MIFLADVKPFVVIFCIGWCYCQFILCYFYGRYYCHIWQMFMPLICGGCFYHIGVFLIIFVDIICIGWCYCQFILWQILLPFILWQVLYHLCFNLLLALIVKWQMLLPFVWKMENHISYVWITSRCYCHGGRWNSHLGWVVFGRCYSHGGWWYCH